MLDLYQFVFTSIDIDIRNRFMADFVCSVYYDSFAKTVANINSNISMFSMGDFIKEFSEKIMFGFVFAAEIHTYMALEANRNCQDRQMRQVTAAKYEKYMLALIRDVIKFLVKANVTLT